MKLIWATRFSNLLYAQRISDENKFIVLTWNIWFPCIVFAHCCFSHFRSILSRNECIKAFIFTPAIFKLSWLAIFSFSLFLLFMVQLVTDCNVLNVVFSKSENMSEQQPVYINKMSARKLLWDILSGKGSSVCLLPEQYIHRIFEFLMSNSDIR